MPITGVIFSTRTIVVWLLTICLALGAPDGEFRSASSSNNGLRIVNGKKAKPGQFPYQVSIQWNNIHFCGGSILSSKVILSAAHCCGMERQSRTTIKVVAGVTSLSDTSFHRQESWVKMMLVHNDYNPDIFDNDLCVVILRTPLDLDSDPNFVSALPLAHESDCLVQANCSISGWGVTKHGQQQGVRDLLWVGVPILLNTDCRRYTSFNPMSMVCAGYSDGQADSCQGDSGGPLQCNQRLCGIVSHGYECAYYGYPGIYTRITNFLNWIEQMDRTYGAAGLGMDKLARSSIMISLLSTVLILLQRDTFYQ